MISKSAAFMISFITITSVIGAPNAKDKRCYTTSAECMTGDKLGFSVLRGGLDQVATLTESTKETFCAELQTSHSLPETWTCMSDHQTVECGDCLKPTFLTNLEKKIHGMHSIDKHLTGVTPDHLFCSPFFLGLMWFVLVLGALELLYEVIRWRESKPLDPMSSWCYRAILLGAAATSYYFGFKKDLEGVRVPK